MPIFILILLFLPVLDIILCVSFIGGAPFVGIPYFLLTTFAGIALMRFAKFGFGEISRQMRKSQNMQPAYFLALGKIWIIGGLLFFPGYLTDVFALLIGVFVAGRTQSERTQTATAESDSNTTPTKHNEATGRFIDDDE